MTILFALSCGDSVHDTFLDVWDEGFAKQIFLIIYMMLFFTAATNIFFALIQTGYDKSRIGKEIKREQEYPNLSPEEMKSVFAFEIDENRPHPKDSAPEIYQLLESGDLSASEKSKLAFVMVIF
jgi:hypothetical protein